MVALEDLIRTGRLHGDLQGRTYVPHMFDKARQQYVDNFFQQNKFIGTTFFSLLTARICHPGKIILSKSQAMARRQI